MPSDFVPAPDAEFDTFATNFVAVGDADEAAYGFVAGDFADAALHVIQWSADYAAAINPATRTSATIAAKNAARVQLEGEIRRLAGLIRARGDAVLDADLIAIGLPLVDFEPTPIAAPATAPLVQIVTYNNLQHVLRIRDEATPLINAKPAGAIGVEIYVSYGDEEPPSPADASYVKLGTRAITAVDHDASRKGLDAWYVCRWINARGERGPWSDQVSGTVVG